MSGVTQDRWAAWFLHRRHGGDPEELRRTLEYLAPIRDRVIAGAQLTEGDTILDVGCGDGLIAFRAAEVVGTSGMVIFSDISAELLDRCRMLADEVEFADRCQYVRAAARDLGPIENASIDAVTMRSVLIYEQDKSAAFAEAHRVLRPGGRLSLFEPINRFGYPEPPGRFMGADVRPVVELAAKVRAVYETIQPSNSDPMVNFDERDLIHLAQEAGFAEIHLQLYVDIGQRKPMAWETFLNRAGNPRIPTLREAMTQALTLEEADHLSTRLRPQIEAGTARDSLAVAYLSASRSTEQP